MLRTFTLIIAATIPLAACTTDPANTGNGDNGDPDDGGVVTIPDGGTMDGQPPATFDVEGITRDNIFSIAEASVGYTYWWGHGSLGGSKTGTCSGSCPSCTHTGTTGADCSGFVAKAWMLPEAEPVAGDDVHPFATSTFRTATTHWTVVSRSDVIRGDALVYNTNGEGHIFLYEKDDPWGSMWSYEARGCSYGVVHDIRTATSAYIAIRRNGL